MTSTSRSRKTTRSRWERLEELFNRAVELPESERERFVLEETVDDAELREELIGLVACDVGKRTGPLTHALGEALDSTTRDKRRAQLGRTVGSYKLKSVLGHGGTGTVYLGERADSQYSAQVAVKIVDSAAVHGDLATRFRAERQILASLNHPNIARLMDAGETEDGRPYLVMEYVEGEPLDQYCDGRKLSIHDRLLLFLEICSAVQYAHQNLVVHRDLKPANILVTTQGTAKLLDFGIAKLLDPTSNASALALTRMNDRLLTPEYASPEQILGKPVTTASDVYALGVVLYELLTGLRPFVVAPTATQLELERSICVTDPQRPSATLQRPATLPPDPERHDPVSIASMRGLTPERLERRLSGDLDAIVMRALRKEPQHRYGSVDQFVADVRRYLGSEPVNARQGNWIYYSQRFVRRNFVGVAASSFIFGLTLAFAIAMSVQTQRTAAERDRATRERATAEQVSEFMANVFTAADPFENLGEEVTARALLDRAAQSISADLSKQPEVRARLLEAIGKAYLRLGQPAEAIQNLQASLRILNAAGMPIAPQVDSVLRELGNALKAAGKFDEADRVFQRAFSVLRSAQREESIAHARLLGDSARLELARGNHERAQSLFTEALPLMQRLKGMQDLEVASILGDLAATQMWHDDLAGAEGSARGAVDIFNTAVPEFYPDRVMADLLLADVLSLQGFLDEASGLYERAIVAQRRLYGGASNRVAESLGALAKIRLAQQRPAEAEQITREALRANYGSKLETHFTTGYLKTLLATALLSQSAFVSAEVELREALAIFSRSLPADHQYIASAEYFLGEVLLSTNRLSEARAALEASIQRWGRTNSPAWRAARSASALGEVAYRRGDIAEAEEQLASSYQVLSTAKGAERDAVEKARQRIARFYRERGAFDKLNALMPLGAQTTAAR